MTSGTKRARKDALRAILAVSCALVAAFGSPLVAAFGSPPGFEQITAFFQGSKNIEFEQRLPSLTHRDDADTGAPPRDEVDLQTGSARLVGRS